MDSYREIAEGQVRRAVLVNNITATETEHVGLSVALRLHKELSADNTINETARDENSQQAKNIQARLDVLEKHLDNFYRQLDELSE